MCRRLRMAACPAPRYLAHPIALRSAERLKGSGLDSCCDSAQRGEGQLACCAAKTEASAELSFAMGAHTELYACSPNPPHLLSQRWFVLTILLQYGPFPPPWHIC